jgi:hypothetical protein
VTINGSKTGSSNLFNNVTEGSITIGNTGFTGSMIILGSQSGVSSLFTNVTGGSITIGNAGHTGTMTIHGSSISPSTLFNNVTTGSITIGGATQSGNLVIGNSNNPLSTVYIGGTLVRSKGSSPIYYTDKIRYLVGAAPSVKTLPFEKYFICEPTESQTIIIAIPSISYEGVELVFRKITSNSLSIKTDDNATAYFIDTSNNPVITLTSPFNTIRLLCARNTLNTYYWIDIY